MKKKLIPAYLSGTLMNIPLFMVVVFLPTYMRQLGATNLQIGLLSTIYFLISIVSSPFWGSLSDLTKNRKIFSVGSILSFSVILFFISKSTSPNEIIILRALIGIVFPAFSTPLLALISEHSSTTRRGGDISWYNASRALGRMVGLIIAGYLTVFFLLSSLFRQFALFVLLSILPVFFLPDKFLEISFPKPHLLLKEMKSRIFPVKEGESLLRKNGLIFLYVSITLRVICIVGFASFLPLYITEELGYSLQFLGVFSAVGSGIMIFGMLLAGHSADILGRKRIILMGLFLSSLTPIFYHFGQSFSWLLWSGRVAHSFGYSFLISGSTAFVGDIARKREQGALMGWIRMAFSIGGVIGPLIMGLVLEPLNYAGSAFLMSSFAFLGMVIALVKVKETTNIEERKSLPKFLKVLLEYF